MEDTFQEGKEEVVRKQTEVVTDGRQQRPMERLLQASHSGGSPWKVFLLTVSILSCWIQPTSAQSDSVSVVPNPPNGTEGSSVILDIQGSSEQPPSYTWYRREVDPSNQIVLYHVANEQRTPTNNRLKVFSNGSLLISNLTLSDADDYIVQFIKLASAQIVTARAHLAVYEAVSKPTISANGTNVLEHSTLVFTCITKHDGMSILWFFSNEPLSLKERKYLSENNQTLTTRNVRREDAGSYQCEVWTPINAKRSDPLTLTVNYGPDHIVFSPDSVGDEIQVTFKNPLILVCQVESYPPAQYEWLVNGTVNSNFSDNTYTIQNVLGKDSGKYTCLAWNNVTELSVSKDITIRVVGEESPGEGHGSSFSGVDFARTVIGVLAGVALIGALICFLFFRKTGGASKQQLSEGNPSTQKHGKDNILYADLVFPKGSALSAQDLGSSPAFSEVPSERSYQVLDIRRVDVYEKIVSSKNPQP